MEDYIEQQMNDNVIPALVEFIKIDNQSSAFEEKERNLIKQKEAIDFCINWL